MDNVFHSATSSSNDTAAFPAVSFASLRLISAEVEHQYAQGRYWPGAAGADQEDSPWITFSNSATSSSNDTAAFPAVSFASLRLISAEVEHQYAQGRYWPEPLVQINPNYQRQGTVQKLVAQGSCMLPAQRSSRSGSLKVRQNPCIFTSTRWKPWPKARNAKAMWSRPERGREVPVLFHPDHRPHSQGQAI